MTTLTPRHAAPSHVARRVAVTSAALVLCTPVLGVLASGTALADESANGASSAGSLSATPTVGIGSGANTAGPYDATPSSGDNQGNGNAPANGTVGNADDKNPPGQLPGGGDANKGFECDDNNGVGDNGGNPAHTGCTAIPLVTPATGTVVITTPVLTTPVLTTPVLTTPATPVTPNAPVTPVGQGGATTTTTATPIAATPISLGNGTIETVVPVAGVVGQAATAAQPFGGATVVPAAAPLGGSTVQAATRAQAGTPAQVAFGSAAPSTLPFTGSETPMLALASALMLALGGVLVRLGRPQAAHVLR